VTLLPGLTSTNAENIPVFVEDMHRRGIRLIALFPTCLDAPARQALYGELETLPGLRIPHVHLRSDCDEGEIEYLAERFGTEAFNIHPRASTHPFGPIPARFRKRFFVENVDVPPDTGELEELGGICPDFSHLENAALQGRSAYVRTVKDQLARFAVGCCHLSAIRVGVPNVWSGEWDHHRFAEPGDLDYLTKYQAYLPATWASLELENTLDEQLAASDYLRSRWDST